MRNKQTGYTSIDKPQNKGYGFFARNPIVPSISIYSAIKLLSLGHLDKIAIDCGELQVDYRKFIKDGETVSLALKELGVREGDIVSVGLDKNYQGVISFMGGNRIGAPITFPDSFSPIKEKIDLIFND